MIRLNQPGLKSFIIYVFSFIFLTLFIYLGIPSFFDYKNNKSFLEKKIFENFGLKINFSSEVKYNIFPSPRLKLKDVEILSFSNPSINAGFAEKVILKIPFNKLMKLNTLDFESAEIINAVVNIKISEIKNFKKYLTSLSYKKAIILKKSKINLLDKKNLLFSIDSKKILLLNNNLFSKLDLKGEVFNTKIKINYRKKNLDKNSGGNIVVGLPEIGLNIKLNINIDEENNEKAQGRANIFFPNNKIYLDYVFNNKVLNISSSKLINNYFKGQLFGDLFLFPFSFFDAKLDISLLKFKNILNSRFVKNNNLLSQAVPFNSKINGKVDININKITSSANIINSGKVNIEFRNGVLIVKEIKLNMNRIGNIKLMGKILQQKKNKLFVFNTKINLDDSKVFYSRFLIPEKNRIDLVPIILIGKIDLESYKITLTKVYFDNEMNEEELEENELLFLQKKINAILSQNLLSEVLKYSNLRKIINSFF